MHVLNIFRSAFKINLRFYLNRSCEYIYGNMNVCVVFFLLFCFFFFFTKTIFDVKCYWIMHSAHKICVLSNQCLVIHIHIEFLFCNNNNNNKPNIITKFEPTLDRIRCAHRNITVLVKYSDLFRIVMFCEL